MRQTTNAAQGCLPVRFLTVLACALGLLAGQAQAAPLDPSLPPGANFDLTHWYLGTPDLPRSGSIPAAALVAGYTNQIFYTGPDGAMVFWCPVTGGTTTNSTYPRSELREQINPPDNTSNWTVYGTHTLDARCKVTKLPSTGKVIIGQIHGYLGLARPLLKYVFANGQIDAQVKQSPIGSDSDVHFKFSNVAFNEPITYGIVLKDGLLTMSFNGATQSVNILDLDPAWANSTFYFKAGSYVQDNSGPATEAGEVMFYELAASHSTVFQFPPLITTQPTNQIGLVGTNTAFTVISAGTAPLSYQWLKDGLALPAATDTTLLLTNIQPTDAGNYAVLITNVFGATTSLVATLAITLTSPPPVIALSEALDTTNLVWTTNGTPPWTGQTAATHDGVDAARSGAIGDGTTTSMQTTVAGPGLLTFWWKASSETNKDYLIFYIGSAEQARISGEVGWQQRSFSIPTGSQVLKWTYSKNGSASAGLDGGWVDEVRVGPLPVTLTSQPTNRIVDAGTTVILNVAATGSPTLNYQWQRNGTNLFDGPGVRGSATNSLTLSNAQPAQSGLYSVIVSNAAGSVTSSNALLVINPIITLAEALDAATLGWTTNGTPPWTGQPLDSHDGVDTARSGAIGDGATTSMQTTVAGPGTVSFWWKVSSQTNKDYLIFYVGSPEQARLSGEVGWQLRSFTVPAGSQVLKWTYSKNGSGIQWQDRAWVDQVSYAPLPPPSAPTGLTATATSMSQINLAWTDASTNENGFRLERSTNGTTFTPLAALGSNVTAFVHTGLLAGVTSYYRVGATNAAGASAWSGTASVTTFGFSAAKINFQPATAPVPPGYLVDSGIVYGDRGNGLAFGWTASNTSNTKDRNSTLSPDQRYDTFITSSGSLLWEITLPRGTYSVLLVAGEANATSGLYKFNVEGTLALNGAPSTTNRWVTGRTTVTVADGRLTVANATGASNNRLCFIEITRSALLLACRPDKTAETGSVWDFDAPAGVSEFCNPSNITVTVASTITNTSGFCAGAYAVTRTWQATDACGGSNGCSQTVTVLDTTPPALACLPDKTVECGSAWSFGTPTIALDAGSGTNVTLAVVTTATNRTGFCSGTFTATRTWSARDACGNSNTCSQTVTVVDTTPPALTCATDKTVERGGKWSFTTPVATDLCGTASVHLAIVSTITNHAGFCEGTFVATRTWSATDACGNSNTCSQAITIVDTIAPTLACLADKTFEGGSAWTFDAPTIVDLDKDAVITILNTITNSAGFCGGTFAATRTWVAADPCGNSNTCSQRVTVVDTVPPALACVPAKSVECGQDWVFDEPSANDLCAGTNVAVAILNTVTNTTGLCGNTFSATRTWAATDGCGNTSVCSQVVTVLDTTPPLLLCADDKTVELGNNWTFDAPFTTDACSGFDVTITITGTETNATGFCGTTFTATRAWLAIDACGNTNRCTQTVVVLDTTPPTLACPAGKIVECGGDWTFDTPAASDFGSGNVTIAIAETVTNVAGFCGTTFTATRTWLATDACGNTNSCSQTVTIVDTTPPTILCSDVTTCDPNIQVAPLVADSCDAHPLLSCVRSDGRTLNAPFPTGRTTVACTATDACTNSTPCQFTVTVRGNIIATALPDQVVCEGSNVTFTTTVLAADPVSYVWKFGGTVVPDANGSTLTLSNVTPAHAGAYCVEVTGPCNSITRCASLGVTNCPVTGLCSLTESVFDNPVGDWNGVPVLTLLTNLLKPSPVVVGKAGVRSTSIGLADIGDLVTRLPARGTAATLPDAGDQLLTTLPLNSKARFDNALLGHAILLSLNLRLDPNLHRFGLSEQFCTVDGVDARSFGIPAPVLAALGGASPGISNTTVTGLLELANRALAGMPVGGASLAQISEAVDAINRGFDGCRALLDCPPGLATIPANDAFASRILITGTAPPPAGHSVTVRGGNVGASAESGEPDHLFAPAARSVWWKWTPSQSGWVSVSTLGSSFDTVLEIYTGASFSELASSASNDDEGSQLAAAVVFYATGGVEYQIAVEGFQGDTGNIVLTITEGFTP